MALTKEEVLRLFQETDRRLQETERLIQKNAERSEDVWRMFEETGRKMQETDRKVKEMTQAIGRLGNRLGEFVEEMVRPAAVRLFQERGLAVHQVFRGATARLDDGEEMEIDLLVVNGGEAVLVETKSELSVDDVREHLSRLARFKRLFSIYQNHGVMGAVAAMVMPDDAARYAYRQGLFVLAQSGDTIVIRNDAKFMPSVW